MSNLSNSANMSTSYKGWALWRSNVGSQTFVAGRHGVTMRAESFETLRKMIDLRPTLTRHDILPGDSEWSVTKIYETKNS
jgi:hypothetical protein